MIDAQEFINELKTYNRYVSKKQEAINKYNAIEVKLEHLNSYTSPAACNFVETTKFINGKLVKKLIPLPKLDPDPNRKEFTRQGYIDQQCCLLNEIKYYERKIKMIKDTVDTLPKDLGKLVWDVYVKKKIQKVSYEKGYTQSSIYISIKDELEVYLNSQ